MQMLCQKWTDPALNNSINSCLFQQKNLKLTSMNS